MGRPKKIASKPTKTLTFEECLPEILEVIESRKFRWQLTAVPSISFDDVRQILLRHLFIKFHLYDQSRPLKPWVMFVVNAQMINLLRNLYGSFAKPCLKCEFYEGNDLCKKFNTCNTNCDLYSYWSRGKKRKFDINLPLPIENHLNECHEITQDNLDVDRTQININERMKKVLKPLEWLVFNLLYIQKLDDMEVCKQLKFKSTEKNRMAGYGRLSQIKKVIIAKVKEELNNGEIEIIKN